MPRETFDPREELVWVVNRPWYLLKALDQAQYVWATYLGDLSQREIEDPRQRVIEDAHAGPLLRAASIDCRIGLFHREEVVHKSRFCLGSPGFVRAQTFKEGIWVERAAWVQAYIETMRKEAL